MTVYVLQAQARLETWSCFLPRSRAIPACVTLAAGHSPPTFTHAS